MKLSREYKDEQQAQAQENALQRMGYCAWRNPKRDGTWEVFWLERSNHENYAFLNWESCVLSGFSGR